jgi:hypothetical protein
VKPEKLNLIRDLFDERRDARREATLLAGSRILRRRRLRRVSIQAFVALAFLAAAVLSLQQLLPVRRPILTAEPPAPVLPAQSLTDAELLALFPDTPVGLISLDNGKKRLVFLRPGDEERFVKRL